MKTKIKVTELSHDDLVNLFSTALYGCDYLCVDYDSEQWNNLKGKYEDMDICFEDKLAALLLAGCTIDIYDGYAEGKIYSGLGELIENEDGEEEARYRISIYDILAACSTTEGYKYAHELFEEESGDYWTANNLLQIAMFGEVVYG